MLVLRNALRHAIVATSSSRPTSTMTIKTTMKTTMSRRQVHGGNDSRSAATAAAELARDLATTRFRDAYAVLDVPRDADVAHVRRAYLRRAVELHPDTNTAPDAAERFRLAASAYRVLSAPASRSAYDALLAGGGGRGTTLRGLRRDVRDAYATGGGAAHRDRAAEAAAAAAAAAAEGHHASFGSHRYHQHHHNNEDDSQPRLSPVAWLRLIWHENSATLVLTLAIATTAALLLGSQAAADDRDAARARDYFERNDAALFETRRVIRPADIAAIAPRNDPNPTSR